MSVCVGREGSAEAGGEEAQLTVGDLVRERGEGLGLGLCEGSS